MPAEIAGVLEDDKKVPVKLDEAEGEVVNPENDEREAMCWKR